MKRCLRPFMLTLVAGLVLSAVWTAFAAAPRGTPPPPDYFPLKVGYWWKYKWTANNKSAEFQLKVLKTEGQGADTLYLVETTMPTQVFHDWYSKPKGWVLMHRIAYPKNNMTGEYKPVKKYLQNPLGKGATWDWSGTGMMDVEIKENSTVAGAETVIVPAGKFSAMRVDTHVVQGGQDVEKKYWFANWVGMVKSWTKSGGVESTTELLDYSFRPKK